MLGAGTAPLKLGGIYNAGPGHTSYAVADFNGDGNLDLAVDSPEGIAILYGNGDGSFQTSRAYAAGQPAMSGALGAFTASGHPDIALSTSTLQAQLLLGQGDGSFLYQGSPGAAVPTSTQTGAINLWSTIRAADVDADGNLDLILTADGKSGSLPQTADGLHILYGDGTGHFAAPYALPPFGAVCTQTSTYYGYSTIGANSNGAAIVNRDFGGFHYIFNGNRHPNYGQIFFNATDKTDFCGSFAHDLVVAGSFSTFAGSSNTDVISQGDGHLYLFPGDGFSPNTFSSGDLSVDGSLTTAGQLTAPALSSTFAGPAISVANGGLGFRAFIGSATTADLDRDGNQDFLVLYHNLDANPTYPVASSPNYLYLWFGSGGGKFLTSAKHPVNPVRIQLSRNYYQVAVADVNGDGIPDLILSDGYLLSYQLGVGDGTFGAEHHLLAGQGINSILTGDLRGIGRQDVVVANGGAVLTNPVANLEVLGTNPDVNTGGVTVLLNGTTAATPPATGSVVASPEPSVFYSGYTLTAQLPGVTQGYTVTFLQDSVVLGSAPVVNGLATYLVPSGNETLPGNHTLEADFHANLSALVIAVYGTHTISRAPVAVTLMPTTPLTVYYGQAVDGYFSITPVDPQNYPATGTYSLTDNGTLVAVCTDLVQYPFSQSQSCPYGYPILLDAGPHTFVILYNGDAVNAPSSSPPIAYTVLPDLTTVALTDSPNPSYYGQPVFWSAAVSGNVTTPVGLLSFLDNGTTLNTHALDTSGLAGFTTPSLTVGNHSLIANFLGSLDFVASSSRSISQSVLPDLTTLTLTSSQNPASFGAAVTFTATVTGNFLQPNGGINFLDGTTLLGSGLLSNGVATFTTSTLSIGTHPIIAVYAGNTNFNPATSTILNQVIQPLPGQTLQSFVNLTSNLNPSAPKQLVTFTATVTVPGAFATIATGSVTFLDGATVLGTGTLSGVGVATFQTASLATGSHPITATYAGAAQTTRPAILASVSPILTQIVTTALTDAPTGFVMTLTPAALTLGVGRTGVITVNIRDVSGFNQPVQISCGNLAPETSCQFYPGATVAAGGGSTTLELLTSAPRDCGTDQPYNLTRNQVPWPLGAPVVLAGLWIFVRRRRTSLGKGLLLLAVATGLAALGGCGHCTDLGTRPGNYSFTVIGTAQGGPVTQTQTVSVPLTMTIP